MKLTEDDYQALLKAAKLYGTAPSTLAGILVSRGVGLALDQER